MFHHELQARHVEQKILIMQRQRMDSDAQADLLDTF
jgi:hypothetical protein